MNILERFRDWITPPFWAKGNAHAHAPDKQHGPKTDTHFDHLASTISTRLQLVNIRERFVDWVIPILPVFYPRDDEDTGRLLHQDDFFTNNANTTVDDLRSQDDVPMSAGRLLHQDDFFTNNANTTVDDLRSQDDVRTSVLRPVGGSAGRVFRRRTRQSASRERHPYSLRPRLEMNAAGTVQTIHSHPFQPVIEVRQLEVEIARRKVPKPLPIIYAAGFMATTKTSFRAQVTPKEADDTAEAQSSNIHSKNVATSRLEDEAVDQVENHTSIPSHVSDAMDEINDTSAIENRDI